MNESRTTIELKVKEILAQVVSLDQSKIESKTSLITDLGIDSFATMELLFNLEDTYNIKIPEDVIRTRFVNVQDIVDYIIERQSEAVAVQELFKI